MLNQRFAMLLLFVALAAAPLPVALAERTTPLAAHGITFSAEKAGFTLAFKGLRSPYKVFATYVLPGERLPLAAVGASGDYRLHATGGVAQQSAPNRWLWQAPGKPGLYPLTIRRLGSSDAITLNVFVMVPYTHMKNGRINGYRIGSYPEKASKHPEVYQRPRGFIEVTPANENTYIAPHFKLRQFLCKEPGGFPKYVVLKEKLLLKLEMLLAEVNARGDHANTFTVMSGYRTPAYNHALGNVKFSAHQYGMAADIYIDSRHRGVMDDLNHDGRVDFGDAVALYRLADRLHVEPNGAKLIGGLGKYHSTQAHGPFVHVDVRGFLARWG